MSNEFDSFLKKHRIISQLTAPGTPQQNEVAERRNRTLLDMMRSMMSFSTLPTSFWGYALENAGYLLNLASSKSVPLTIMEMWTSHKPGLHHVHIWGCPAHVLKPNVDKLELRLEVCQFVGYPKGTMGYYFYSQVDQKAIPIVHEIDPTDYDEAMSNVDAHFWQKAMEVELESMHSNHVWELVEAPKGIKPTGYKWVYKRKRGVDGKVETFKARFFEKGYSQKPIVNYGETFLADSHAQPDGFVAKGQEHMVCKLHKSIYGLKQASRSWNKRFDQAIKAFYFDQNEDEPYVYKNVQESMAVFMILYVDDILLIGNDVRLLSLVKIWFSTQFQMKDLGEAQYILWIKVLRDHKNRKLVLSQDAYIDKLLVKYVM
ncbi:Retrovirus-related Pol polyprotein from transposon TNT 1-94 [Vitis vinifera]|uniref:Retrovirus-related Pol polyprotein from transposon TNT 1-94 n=1 Tax=Vitis vinifera TaxID=29760 RepID=A0A438BNR9_VITVI|nr:Retrovirus-related Pol polyprotein from transposon TNT 1-94 [Vitis vinifera]